MTWSWPRFLLTLLVGLAVALVYAVFFRNKGKRYEEVYDRVVEESTDESAKMKTLVAGHATALSAHSATLGEQHSKLEADWKRKVADAEASTGVHAARVAELETSVGHWENRHNSVAAERDNVASRLQALTTEHEAVKVNHARELLALATIPVAVPATTPASSAPAAPDDLLIIEGIGPKINQALITAGITTFPALVAASEDQLNAAISAAGMSFAPSLPTWGKQAAFLTRGDRAGFDAYVEHLVAGRDPSA